MHAIGWSELRTELALPFRASAASGESAMRLLILAHGVGGNETHLAALGSALAESARVILVRAPLRLGPGQHAWFQVSFGTHGPRPDLAAAETSRRQLARFVGELQQEFAVPAAKTLLAGFSQGGIISASVGLTEAARIKGFGILCGRILPELRPQLADRAALASLEAFVGHGQDDSKLTVEWAHRADALLEELGVPHETRLYPGNHSISAAMQSDFIAWVKRVLA